MLFSTTCWSMWRLSIEEDGSVVGDTYELAGNFYTLYFFYLKHCKAYLLHASCFTARSLTSKCLKGYSRTKWQQKAWKGKPYRAFGAHLLKLLVLATQIFVQELELLLSIICTMATQKRFKNFLLCLVPEWPFKVHLWTAIFSIAPAIPRKISQPPFPLSVICVNKLVDDSIVSVRTTGRLQTC